MRSLPTSVLLGALLLGGCATDRPVGPSDPVPDPPGPPDPALPRWSDPATWAPAAMPGAGEDVTIPAGVTIVLDTTPPALGQLRIDGELLVSDSSDLELAAEEILVAGRLAAGTEALRHRHRFIITLSAGQGAERVGTKVLAVLAGGTLDLHGADRLGWTRLAATAEAGATSLRLRDAHDWRPGDRIVVASTDFDPNHAEELEVWGGSGTEVQLGQSLVHRHWGVTQQVAGRTVDERAEVALLTRNIVIRGDASSDGGFGGHVISLAGGTMRVEGVELYRMGQAGVIARYPLHWHMAGSVPGQYVRNNSIWRTNQRCITIHGTDDAEASGNVCYDHQGHGYFLEDGSESGNLIVGNLGLVSRVPAQAVRLLASDANPATFWLTHPANTVHDNHAAGSTGFGFWYALPVAPTGLSTGQPDAPRLTPLGSFRGNVAHSNRRAGLQVDDGPRADGTTEVTSYTPRLGALSGGEPVPAIFEDFTGWKHRGRAVWLRGTAHRLRGAVLADNMIGATFASSESWLEDALVIGETANQTAIPDPTFPIRGYEFYDGTVGARRVTFVNFMPTAQRPASALGYNRNNSFAISTANFGEAIALVNANAVWLEDPRADRDGDKAAVFRDIDGSVTGEPGRTVVANAPLLVGPSCTWRAEWNSWICPERYVQLQVRSDAGEAVAPLTLARGDGSAATALVGIPNAPSRAFMSVVPGRGYRVTWNGAQPLRPRLVLSRVAEGDRVRVDFPYPATPVRVVRDYQNGSPLPVASSLADAEAAGGDRWWRDPSTGLVTVILHVRSGRTSTTVELQPQ
ncbi:MAG TPA: G8 domain-containing protein [Gemmatimonadales bacterium]|nr:G8 domain-containing protein [Gemmatimonadales bacterium]